MPVRLQTVGVIVRDLAAAVAFYRAAGLALPDPEPGEDNLDCPLDSGVTLGFLTERLARAADPAFVTPVGQALNLQLLCDSPAEVDRVHARLVELGYQSHAAPWDAPWGQRFARVKDPDGRVVNFYAPIG
jgi:catechol 2,3-dioxygenase-like lactoylglutathione lyase family enzyme